ALDEERLAGLLDGPDGPWIAWLSRAGVRGAGEDGRPRFSLARAGTLAVHHAWRPPGDPPGDGLRLLVGDEERNLSVVDGDGRELFRPADRTPLCIAVSPDRTRLAVTWINTANEFWSYDVAAGKRLLRFAGHTDRVLALRFRPDGAQIASVSDDGTA